MIDATWLRDTEQALKNPNAKKEELLNLLHGAVAVTKTLESQLQEHSRQVMELKSLPPVEPEWPDQRQKVLELQEAIRGVLRNPTVLPPLMVGQLRKVLS